MNILYHHRTQGKTVEGVHIREVVKALRELGHNVIIVSPPGVDPFANERAETTPKKRSLRATVLGFISKHIPQFGFELMELVYNFVAYKNIKAVIASQKIDFIYERFAFFSMAGALASKNYNIPLIEEVNI
jgi:UDP-N-acetylglucosamine:LPS N-acetylglucosamine transferase